jgi:hypothetical protein
MTDRCPRCDRAECRRPEKAPAEIHAAIRRVLDADGRASAADRTFIDVYFTERLAIDEECRRHPEINWRAEALAMRPVVEAEIAVRLAHEAATAMSDVEPEWRVLTARLQARIVERNAAIDTYRTRKP